MSVKKNIIGFILLFFCCNLSYSEAQDSSKNHNASLFLFTAGYRVPVNNNKIINSGKGLYLEAGFNAMRLFSKRSLFGLYGGFGFKDNFWKTEFNNNFKNDFINSFSEHQLSGLDSVVVNSSKKLISENGTTDLSGCGSNSFHNTSLYYGVMFNIPIFKYHPVIKVYSGVTKTILKVNNSIVKNTEFNYLAFKRHMYGIELVLFPGRTKKIKDEALNNLFSINIAALSLYYESCSFSKGVIYFNDGKETAAIPFSAFMASDFLKKYQIENTFGIKCSIRLN